MSYGIVFDVQWRALGGIYVVLFAYGSLELRLHDAITEGVERRIGPSRRARIGDVSTEGASTEMVSTPPKVRGSMQQYCGVQFGRPCCTISTPESSPELKT
jgi:hypothetical protein